MFLKPLYLESSPHNLFYADIYSPLKEDETVDETTVNIMCPFDDETHPPVLLYSKHAYELACLCIFCDFVDAIYLETTNPTPKFLSSCDWLSGSVLLGSFTLWIKKSWRCFVFVEWGFMDCFCWQVVTEYDWQFDEFDVRAQSFLYLVWTWLLHLLYWQYMLGIISQLFLVRANTLKLSLGSS